MVELNKRGVYFDGVTESKKNGNPTGWGFVFKGEPHTIHTTKPLL
jgi:ribonuclease HI